MPHVDDGTLHALIDGALRAEEPELARQVEAHLETCADCRARLDEATETRDRAAGILAAADAGLVPEDTDAEESPRPDFADVLARAERGGQGAGAGPRTEPAARWARQYRWTRGLAWAATIVIALGAGYMVRDLVGPTGELRSTRLEQQAPAAERAAGDVAGPALTGAAANGDAGGDDAGTEATAPGAEGDAGPERAEVRSADEEAAARSPARSPTAEPAPADAAADLQASVVESPEPRAAGQGAATEPVATADAPAAMVDAAVTSPWRSATMEEAEVAAGPIHLLPGATLTAVETADGRVRTRQVLRDGAEVLVVQSRTTDDAAAKAGDEPELEAVRARSARAGAAPAEMTDVANVAPTLLEADLDSLAAVTDTSATVTVVRDGVRLELTGRLPADLLRALGAVASPSPGG